MSIFVVRHGETTLNAARVIQLPDTPLSANGYTQASRLAERVAIAGVTGILSSDLVRAVETAMVVGSRTGVRVELEPALRERDFGDLRGTPYSQLTVDPFGADYVPPNGEDWAAFHARVLLAWGRITRFAAGTAGNLLVVTHGLVCRALVERHLALPPGESPVAPCGNTALTEIDAIPPWRVRRLNCMAHLTEETRRAGAGV